MGAWGPGSIANADALAWLGAIGEVRDWRTSERAFADGRDEVPALRATARPNGRPEGRVATR